MSGQEYTRAAWSAAFSGAPISDVVNTLTSAAIENHQERSTEELKYTQILPIKLHPHKTSFEKIGFVFGDKKDDLFYNVTFPEGWKTTRTESDYWTDIVDDKGRRRVSTFYKAAFYDRDAFSRLIGRFSIDKMIDSADKLMATIVVKDWEKVIWTSPTVSATDWSKQDNLRHTAGIWLDQNYPDWKDPVAYLDEEETNV